MVILMPSSCCTKWSADYPGHRGPSTVTGCLWAITMLHHPSTQPHLQLGLEVSLPLRPILSRLLSCPRLLLCRLDLLALLQISLVLGLPSSSRLLCHMVASLPPPAQRPETQTATDPRIRIGISTDHSLGYLLPGLQEAQRPPSLGSGHSC